MKVILAIFLFTIFAHAQGLKFQHQETVRIRDTKNRAAELGSELIVYATLMQRKSWLQYCFEKQLLYEDIKSTELFFDVRVDRSQKIVFSDPEFLSEKAPHLEMRRCIQRSLDQLLVPEALSRDYQIHLVFQRS